MILLEPLRFCSRISPFACRSPQEMADQLLDLPFPLANEGDESQLLNLDSTHQRFIYDRGELNHVLPGRIGIARELLDHGFVHGACRCKDVEAGKYLRPINGNIELA